MNFESNFGTRHGGSKRIFPLLLLTFFLAPGYQATVRADNLIGGTVSLPGGDVAPAGGLWFKVSAWDTNSGRSYGYGDDFYIPEGDRSAAYSMTVPSDASAQWQVAFWVPQVLLL